MSNFVIQTNRLLFILLIILVIQACASSSKTQTQPEIVIQSLEELLKQAQNAQPEDKNPLLVQAAGLLNLEKRFDKSQELLIRIDKTLLNPQQLDDFHLYLGEALLGLKANELSLKQLKSITSPSSKPIDWQIRYSQSLSESYLANSNYYEAAKQIIELDDLITDPEILKDNHEKIWFSLDQIEAEFLPKLITGFNSQRVNGWLEIVHINKNWGHEPQKLLAKIEQWKARYPLHPSAIYQPEALELTATARMFYPQKIAVLLPLSGNGQIAKISLLIQEGILAAYYDSAKSSNQNSFNSNNSSIPALPPKINFYDSSTESNPMLAYQQAIKEGADFILGPLSKTEVQKISEQANPNIPILALNTLENQSNTHLNLFQFGLPIEDEAIQVAYRAFEKGYRKAIAFLPEDSLGKRAENSFKEYFEKLGGELIQVQTYKSTDSLKILRQKIAVILGVDKSLNRKKALQKLLGRNIEFNMRRRKDTDFIFIMAQPTDARSIKPFIDSYYGNDLPIIATSRIFSGKHIPKVDNDLNRIEFPDIPLLVSELPEFKKRRQWLKQVNPDITDAKIRYFSLGYDSYKVLKQLSILRAFPNYHWNGLSGELIVDSKGLVHRYLTWAQFKQGLPHITKEREVKKLEENIEFNNPKIINPYKKEQLPLTNQLRQ